MRLAARVGMRWFRLLVVVLWCGCEVGQTEDDSFWDDTTDDDGSDGASIAAGATRRVAITGGDTKNAERLDLLPIGRSESSAPRRVALHLTPGQLPSLMKGDRLIVPAELQVTTRCDIGQSAPGCDYNPHVRAQLILTGNPDDTQAAGNSRAIATQTVSCTKTEHHCMFVFRPGEASIRLGDGTPCVARDDCHVNLVVWAWSPDARGGGQDKLLIGGNDRDFLQNGKVEPDLARIMAVRERGIGPADRKVRESSGSGTQTINTSANAELVYSHRLEPAGRPLKKGEQFVIEARVVAKTSGRARFSTELFVTRDGHAAEGGGFDSIEPRSIGEQNGTNCDGTCVTRKVAVFRATDDIDDGVFVNVAVKSAVPGGGNVRVTVDRSEGWVRSVRYPAALGD